MWHVGANDRRHVHDGLADALRVRREVTSDGVGTHGFGGIAKEHHVEYRSTVVFGFWRM